MPMEKKRKKQTPIFTKQCVRDSVRYIFLECGPIGVRLALIIIGSVNIIWALFLFAWFWIIEETPYPPLLGFAWTTHMRATLMPEACVSLGLSVYLVYGAATRNTTALLVPILCQWLIVLGTFVFGFLYLINVGFTPLHFLALIWLYFATRAYILILNMHYFYDLIGEDPWRRSEEVVAT